MDPFSYGKAGDSFLPPFLSLLPCAPQIGFQPLPALGYVPASSPVTVGLLSAWATGRSAWITYPASLPFLSSDYETVRNGGLIFAALAFVVGLIIILSKWGRPRAGRGC